MTYEECAAAGMTQADAARAMGRSKAAVSVAAKRLGLTFAGRSPSPETIEKLRAARIGKKPSPETVEKMRVAHLGKKHSPETIEKMRAARIGSLVHLTGTERADYDTMRRHRYTRAEALTALGRDDLIGGNNQ